MEALKGRGREVAKDKNIHINKSETQIDHISSNNWKVVIRTKKNLLHTLPNHLTPYAVLLTAHTLEDAQSDTLIEIIVFLLEQGAMYFVCLGTFSEILHDQLDEFFVMYSLERQGGDTLLSRDVITTWHDKESIEESVHFFIFSTEIGIEIREKSSHCLVAVLDEHNAIDRQVSNALLSM